MSVATGLISRRLCRRSNVSVLTFLAPSSDNNSLLPHGTPIVEHRLNPDFVASLHENIELSLKDNCAAIVLHNEGKYWSNGMDLKWIDSNLEDADTLQKAAERSLAAVLTCPVPTVASMAGHATAAGAMLSLACDYRVMGERGLYFIPAVELGLVYSPGMIALMRAKLSPNALRDIVLFGNRYNAKQLEEDLQLGRQAFRQRGPATEVAKHWPDFGLTGSGQTGKFSPDSSSDYVLASVMQFLEKDVLTKKREYTVLQETKQDLYTEAFKKLRGEQDFKSMGWAGRASLGLDTASKL